MEFYQEPHTDTYQFLGYELSNHRYSTYHIVNYNHSWETDITRFPGFQNSFFFERAFIPIGNYVQELTFRFWHWSFYISAIYLAIIFSIQKIMESRKPFNLRTPLILWNAFLAVFSIVGVYRCLPEFIHIVYNEGLAASFTKASYYAVSFLLCLPLNLDPQTNLNLPFPGLPSFSVVSLLYPLEGRRAN